MKITQKIMCGIVCAALLAAFIPGCSSEGGSDTPAKTDVSGNVITTAGTNIADDTGNANGNNSANGTDNANGTQVPGNDPGGTVPKTPEEIRQTYVPSAEESEELAEEDTAKTISYTGFKGTICSTPALKDGMSSMVVIPVFSHAGIHQYMEDNAANFDFGEGEGSFAAIAESYHDDFFKNKGLLIVSFIDSEGGSDHKLMGGWEDLLYAGEMEIEQLVLAVKKSDGDVTAGHILVEMDKDFIGIWDSFGLNIYK